jgi:hypothetical protein
MGESYKFILFALIFYGIIAVILVSMGINSNISSSYVPPSLPENPTLLNYILIPFQYIGFFFGMIGYTIVGLPWWFNFIIFFPIGMTILWIIISLIRGYGG